MPRKNGRALAPAEFHLHLSAHAVQSLIDEANLTPKPALVDRRGSGAHSDLTLDLMHRSAHSLYACFLDLAAAASGHSPAPALRTQLASIGRAAESSMLAATGGANSHKGAIWSVGLLIAAAAINLENRDPIGLAETAARIARFPDAHASHALTHGERAQQIYGVPGARGEAQHGFPHVVHIGLPALHHARSRRVCEQYAQLDALMAIMATLDDTCLLHRGGLRALRTAQQGAQRVLRAGGSSTPRGLDLLLRLDKELLKLNASPGGSADLLAATLFLDSIANYAPTQNSANHPSGLRPLWKN
jgi:triphosphoribosyl-dephospho-CoA synthase